MVGSNLKLTTEIDVYEITLGRHALTNPQAIGGWAPVY